MRVKRSFVAASFLLAAAAISQPAVGAASAAPSSSTPQEIYDGRSSEMIQAAQRDLHLTDAELRVLLTNQADAGEVVEQLEESLGSSFGGAWVDADDADLTVAITDPDEADEVRAAGAEPEVVTHSEDNLDSVQAGLDRKEVSAPASVSGWYVDVTTNSVVVLAAPGRTAAADEFVAGTGVDADAVQVEVTTEQPQLLYDVLGGHAYYTPQYRCSIGFSVVGGFVTAGHCGTVGTSTSGYNRVAQGTFSGSRFPGSDEAWVQVNQNWVPRPVVNRYDGSTVTVLGSQEAPIGAAVCRSGSTTGWRCGTLQAKNQTVLYAEGTVSGLTRTSACAQSGDSGGSFMWGNQAQGMLSGGSGSCWFGGVTYFQPVNPTLQRYGLTLVTG